MLLSSHRDYRKSIRVSLDNRPWRIQGAAGHELNIKSVVADSLMTEPRHLMRSLAALNFAT